MQATPVSLNEVQNNELLSRLGQLQEEPTAPAIVRIFQDIHTQNDQPVDAVQLCSRSIEMINRKLAENSGYENLDKQIQGAQNALKFLRKAGNKSQVTIEQAFSKAVGFYKEARLEILSHQYYQILLQNAQGPKIPLPGEMELTYNFFVNVAKADSNANNLLSLVTDFMSKVIAARDQNFEILNKGGVPSPDDPHNKALHDAFLNLKVLLTMPKDQLPKEQHVFSVHHILTDEQRNNLVNLLGFFLENSHLSNFQIHSDGVFAPLPKELRKKHEASERVEGRQVQLDANYQAILNEINKLNLTPDERTKRLLPLEENKGYLPRQGEFIEDMCRWGENVESSDKSPFVKGDRIIGFKSGRNKYEAIATLDFTKVDIESPEKCFKAFEFVFGMGSSAIGASDIYLKWIENRDRIPTDANALQILGLILPEKIQIPKKNMEIPVQEILRAIQQHPEAKSALEILNIIRPETDNAKKFRTIHTDNNQYLEMIDHFLALKEFSEPQKKELIIAALNFNYKIHHDMSLARLQLAREG